jgi:CheY-like chemotaxis protein
MDQMSGIFMPENSGGKPKVLLVEDNETYRKVVRNAMQLDGFEFHEAENGKKALEKLSILMPQVILCDISMPEMDGLTFLAKVKSDDKFKNIPIVMLTNFQEELDNSVKQGAEEALLKSSITPHQLIEVCRKYVTVLPTNTTS